MDTERTMQIGLKARADAEKRIRSVYIPSRLLMAKLDDRFLGVEGVEIKRADLEHIAEVELARSRH